MMNMVIEYFYCLIYVLSLTIVISYLCQERPNIKRALLIIPVYTLINSLLTGNSSNELFEYIIVNSLNLIFDCVYIYYLYTHKKIENIFYVTLFEMFYILSINIIIHIIDLIYVFNRVATMSPSIERTAIIILINTLTIMLVVLTKRVKLLPSRQIIRCQPNLFILLNILVFYAMMIIYNIGVVELLNLIMILVFILLMLWGIFLRVLSLYIETTIKNEELIMEDISNKYISKYIEFYRQESENLRKIKHDLKSHKEILENIDKFNSYSDYVDDIFSDINNNYIQTGNVFIDSCLYIKQKEYPNIMFDYDIAVANLTMNEKDITSLLFNLIDNACYEAQKNDQKVKVLIRYENNILVIKVKNRYERKPNFISTKGLNHGYGLKIIHSIVDKYSGDLTIDYPDDYIRFNIKMSIQCKNRAFSEELR